MKNKISWVQSKIWMRIIWKFHPLAPFQYKSNSVSNSKKGFPSTVGMEISILNKWPAIERTNVLKASQVCEIVT